MLIKSSRSKKSSGFIKSSRLNKSSRFAVCSLSAAIISNLVAPQVFAVDVILDKNASSPDQSPLIETVTVVSSRTPTPLREIGTSISVLDEQQIKARGFNSLADVLRVMPSVSLSNAGGMGNPTSISIRGEQGYRTLIRVDGIDVADTTTPQSYTQIQHLMSANIARVELLRGPQGMMYGADAGGVVLISTPRVTDGFKSDLTAEAGSRETSVVSGGIGGGNNTGDFYVSASQNKADGFNASKKDLTQDLDGYKNTTLHARGDLNISESFRFEAVVRKTDAENQYDRCSFPSVDDCRSTFHQTNARAGLVYKTDSGENTLSYSHANLDRATYALGNKEFSYDGQINRLEFNGNTRFNAQSNFVYGLERRDDEAGKNQRAQDGIYAEYQGRYDNHVFITAGVRNDKNDDFGSHSSYRVSGAYLVPAIETGVLKFKTSIGTGFRAPSLYEVSYNRDANQFTPGLNMPSLKAEESEGADLGAEYYFEQGSRLELTFFKQKISQEIYFDLINFSGYLQEAQESESKGVELAADILLSESFSLNANYTHTSTRADDGSQRLRKPENLANIGFTYKPTSEIHFSMNLRSASDAIDTDKKPLDNYTVADANISYEFAKGDKVYLRGENIFDKHYIEVRNYNTAGASVYVGLNLSF